MMSIAEIVYDTSDQNHTLLAASSTDNQFLITVS